MKKRLKFILLILILIFVFLILRSTYSKYIEEEEASVVEEIADWVIKVNDVDITVVSTENSDDTNTTTDNTTSTETSSTSGATFYITGDDLVIYESSNVTDGKLAPGSKGYFYIRIDPEETKTALKYTISIDTSELAEKGVNLELTTISDENGKTIKTAVSGTKQLIQRIKNLDEVESTDESSRIDKIKVEFEWIEDDETNDLDTELGENSTSTISLPVNVHAIQYVGQGYDI